MLGQIKEDSVAESVYSTSGSSKMSTKKRIPNRRHTGTASSTRQPASEIQQRVQSARMLRYKSLQNQLSEAHQQIFDLTQENRSLRTTVRRQEKALEKYDSANAELPRLLKNHQDEVRVFQERIKGLQKTINEMSSRLKQKDNTLQVVTDQNKHYQQLNKERHLDERLKLTQRVKELQLSFEERDNALRQLGRKYQLETKMLKVQLQQEQTKSRDLQKKLDAANMEVTRQSLLNNARNGLAHFRNHRETQSATTDISYRIQGTPNHMYRRDQSCSESHYSRSPLCEAPLYEEEKVEEDVYLEQKVREFEKQKMLHLEKVALLSVGDETLDAEQELVVRFEALNRKDINEKESILDSVCDNVIHDNSEVPHTEKEEPSKKHTIDPKSKTKLLAALKAIDSNESFDS